MTEQLEFLPEQWGGSRRFDQKTRRAGREGIARARARLEANRCPIEVDLKAA